MEDLLGRREPDMDMKGGVAASNMTPEERRAWVEHHDKGYTQRGDGEKIYSEIVYNIAPCEPDDYGRDNTVVCRTHAVDKHGWGYRREIKWGVK